VRDIYPLRWGWESLQGCGDVCLGMFPRRFEASRCPNRQYLSSSRRWPHLSNNPKIFLAGCIWRVQLKPTTWKSTYEAPMLFKMTAAINLILYQQHAQKCCCLRRQLFYEVPGSNLGQERAIITNVSVNFTQSLETNSGLNGHQRNLPHSVQFFNH
jgi:hypothetical protein